MPTKQFAVLTRRRIAGVAFLIGAAVLLAAQASSIGAQQPKTPHWFWGADASQYVGAQISAINQDGVEVDSDGEGSGVVNRDGGWWVTVSPEDARTVKLRLVLGDMVRETDALDVIEGGFDPEGLSIAAFSPVSTTLDESGNTISVRIIARRAEDGRIEFGMRDPDGVDIFPRARYFPAAGPDHNRFLRSSEIDFGSGYTGRIIARRAPDGRVEFGFRVEGYDDIFPRARYFPASGPDHNRFLRSSEIEIGMPR